MTFENWWNWQWWRDTNALTNEAYEDKNHKFHKMAVCHKLSRKRLVKLLMATGKFDKRGANAWADAARNAYGFYRNFWYRYCYEIIRNIDVRYVAFGDTDTTFLHKVFGNIIAPDMMPVSPRWWMKDSPYSKENWENDKALLEAYPDVHSLREASMTKFAKLKEMSESGNWNIDIFKDIMKLESWFRWAEPQDRKKEAAANA